MNQNEQEPEREPETDPPKQPRSRTDRWIKMGFLAVAVVVGVIIWRWQGRDPELVGWGTDLNAALQVAKDKRTKVVVFFTRAPMGYEDKRVAKSCIRRPLTINALRHLGYRKVHLTTRAHKQYAKQFDVTETPTILLLDPDGKVVKRHEGFITDLVFCNEFLGVTGAEMSEPDQPSPP